MSSHALAPTHLVAAPVLLPLFAGVLLLFAARLEALSRRILGLSATLAQLALALALLSATAGGDILVYALGDWPAPFGIVLVADRLAAWMLLITALVALFALFHASRGDDLKGRHFPVLFQLQLFGLNGAFLTGDLFNLFVFFEILLLASYGLLLHGGGPARTRAGLHFVIINLVGSTLFLFAVGALYGVLGTLNMADLALKVAAAPAENLGVVRAAGLLLFAVFALKAALLPLYLWLPAAYASATPAVAALFAIMTKVGVYSLLRVYTLIFGAGAGGAAGLIDAWLLPLALATLVLGALGALASRELRHQIAYFVVASTGFLLTTFGLGSAAGIAAGLYYLPHTTFAAAAFFLLAEAIARRRGVLADRFDPGPDIAGGTRLGALFFLTALLVAGLPPLSGFLGKFMTLRAALAHPAWPAVMAIVLSAGLLSLIALARSGSLLFFRAQGRVEPTPSPATLGELAPVLALLGLCLALTAGAGPASEFVRATADQLLTPHAYVHAVLGQRN